LPTDKEKGTLKFEDRVKKESGWKEEKRET
jgi:hypothetical protein